MKTAPAALVTFFNSVTQGLQFDLWTFALASGTVVRWTDADVDFKLADGRSFVRGPVLQRDRLSWARGIEVDQLRVKLAGPTVVVDGQQLPAFAAAGGFDGAWAVLERIYLDGAAVVQGTLQWFSGPVADITPGRMGCDLVAKSQLTQLQQQLPRNLYQSSCLNDLYDSSCGANRAAFQVTGSVTAVGTGSIPTLTATLASAQAAGFFDLGVLKFTSGANAGLGRTVKQHAPGGAAGVGFTFSRPFPFAVAAGDAFTVWAGCDKRQSTCSGKFNNLGRFRGAPFIPVPETVT